MSWDLVVPLLAVALGGLLSLLGVYINDRSARARERLAREERDRRREAERREWYSQQLFDRRVQAVQDAFTWLMRINVAMSRGAESPENAEILRVTVREARDWYDRNTIWLNDGVGGGPFVGLCNSAPDVLRAEPADDPYRHSDRAFKQYDAAWRFIHDRAESLVGLASTSREDTREGRSQ